MTRKKQPTDEVIEAWALSRWEGEGGATEGDRGGQRNDGSHEMRNWGHRWLAVDELTSAQVLLHEKTAARDIN